MDIQDYVLPKSFKLLLRWKIMQYSFLVIALSFSCYIVLTLLDLTAYSDGDLSWDLFFGIAVVFVLFEIVQCVCLFLSFGTMRIEMTENGITFYELGHKIYTPWQNLEGIGTRWFFSNRRRGFFLKERAIPNISVLEGKQRNIAVLETETWARLVFVTRHLDFAPISFFISKNGKTDKDTEFWSYIRHYAPQVFEQQTS